MIQECTEKLKSILRGGIPKPIDLKKIKEEDEIELAATLNQLIAFVQEIDNFIIPLSRGELAEIRISPRNFLGSPFKELHSRLLHLTWQANQVASGDFSQRVDFMGEFSTAFNHMIVSLKNHEEELQKKIAELEEALSRIVMLEGILPICSYCKKIRLAASDPSDQVNWIQMEQYITDRSEAYFSHSICPECLKKHFPDD